MQSLPGLFFWHQHVRAQLPSKSHRRRRPRRRGNANKNNVTDIHALVRHSQKAQRIPREAAMAPVSGARSGLRTRCKQDKRPLEQLSNRERGARAAKDLVDGVRTLPVALQLAVS